MRSELLLASALILLSVAIVVPEWKARARESRDARRLREIERVQAVVESFVHDRGRLPGADFGPDGWDWSGDGSFLAELVSSGYLTGEPREPTRRDGFRFGYRVFDAAPTAAAPGRACYVLAIARYESNLFKSRRPGGCAGFSAQERADLAYVAGGREPR